MSAERQRGLELTRRQLLQESGNAAAGLAGTLYFGKEVISDLQTRIEQHQRAETLTIKRGVPQPDKEGMAFVARAENEREENEKRGRRFVQTSLTQKEIQQASEALKQEERLNNETQKTLAAIRKDEGPTPVDSGMRILGTSIGIGVFLEELGKSMFSAGKLIYARFSHGSNSGENV